MWADFSDGVPRGVQSEAGAEAGQRQQRAGYRVITLCSMRELDGRLGEAQLYHGVARQVGHLRRRLWPLRAEAQEANEDVQPSIL